MPRTPRARWWSDGFSDAYLEGLLGDDCPYDDLTTEGLGIGDTVGVVEAAPKAEGIVAGLDAACRLFELRGARVERLACDGERSSSWATAMTR